MTPIINTTRGEWVVYTICAAIVIGTTIALVALVGP